MTTAEIMKAALETPFFSKVSTWKGDERSLALTSLMPWWKEELATEEDLKTAEEIDWLPTGPSDEDPFYGKQLNAMLAERDMLSKAQAIKKEVRFLVLKATSGKNTPLLKCGPHNLNGAARKTAVEAFARATMEALLEIDASWCYVVRIYSGGWWPCGRKGGLLVVY